LILPLEKSIIRQLCRLGRESGGPEDDFSGGDRYPNRKGQIF